MANNDWDNYLHDLLGEYKPETPASPKGNPEPVENTTETGQPTSNLKDSDSANPADLGWKRIEAELDAADHAFDETLRRKIAHFNPQYDPHTWPLFVRRLTDAQFLRTKLVVLKSIEVAAILLLLLTAINLDRMGTLHILSPGQDKAAPDRQLHQPRALADAIPGSSADVIPYAGSGLADEKSKSSSEISSEHNRTIQGDAFAENRIKSSSDFRPAYLLIGTTNTLAPEVAHKRNTKRGSILLASLPVNNHSAVASPQNSIYVPAIPPAHHIHEAQMLALNVSPFSFEPTLSVTRPPIKASKKYTVTELGILFQADYNLLRMPEDRLVTSGQQIIFPQKGIASHGFGAGFSLSFSHPGWALETGIIYSEKDFKPGRQLIVGGAFDNGSVDFEAMRLQMITVPVLYRHKVIRTGRIRPFALAGTGINIIIKSDIDVQIKYHFPSLSYGQNPNSDPDIAETIAESRRISEHIRDGAPFSTKSFLSLMAGGGVEYYLTPNKIFFLQGLVQYQIPDISFSNNNGKHLRSVSIQAGFRTPLVSRHP